METVLELIIQYLGLAIYGTEEKPRHPIWRNIVRLIAFSGAAFSILHMLDMTGSTSVPLVISALWLVTFMIVLSTEYYFGPKKLAYAIIAVFLIWISVLVWTTFGK